MRLASKGHVPWEAVWTTDPRSLAALRAGLGVALLVDLAGRAADLHAHYTDEGVLPRAALSRFGRLAIPLHRLSGEAWAQGLLFTIAAIAALALILGYRTRAATLVSYLLLLSLHDRNPLILEGGDGLLRILLFFGLFLPLDAAFAVDARRRGAPPPREVAGPAVLALHVQIACIYAFAAIIKLRSPHWRAGTALGHALAGYHLTTQIGNLVAGYPPLAKALSYGALAIEALAPLALLYPSRSALPRALGVGSIALLQLGIAATMNIGNFQPMAILALAPLIPSALWDRLGTSAEGPRLAAPDWPRPWALAPMAVTAYVIGLNVASLILPHGASTRFERLAFMLGIDQRWDMFAMPRVEGRATGWTILAARRADGQEIDLLRGGAPLSWGEPVRPSDIYGGFRARSFMLWSIWFEAKNRAGYAAYLCHDWNRSHGAGDRIDALAIVWMRQVARADGALGPVERVVLWRGRCPD